MLGYSHSGFSVNAGVCVELQDCPIFGLMRLNFLPVELDAQAGEGSQVGPDLEVAVQPAPDFEVDQRISW
jgi:hypothetical protein